MNAFLRPHNSALDSQGGSDGEVKAVYDASPENVSDLRQELRTLASLAQRLTAHRLAAEQLALQYLVDSRWESGFNVVDGQGVRYNLIHASGDTVEIATLDGDCLVLVDLAGRDTLSGLWRLRIDHARKLFPKRISPGNRVTTQQAFNRVAECLLGTASENP